MMRTIFPLMQEMRENIERNLNLDNRIAEDEKLRNLSKKLVNSKSNDRTKREATASEINESIKHSQECRS